MDSNKFLVILNSIDWVFAFVILIGGRYFGTKYFRLSKRDSLNFLSFATGFAIVYLAIIYFTKGIGKDQVANLFITYLVVTSFYEIIAQHVFEWIEDKFPGKKKEVTATEAVAKFEIATGEKVVSDDKIKVPIKPDDKSNEKT